MNCSHARYGQCTCRAGDPLPGQLSYAYTRRHVDAGDLDALRMLTDWLKARRPFCHVRYADGEFMSILGAKGANCDGQDHRADTLGVELAGVLAEIAALDSEGSRTVLVGGDWRRPIEAWGWLKSRGYHMRIPWCPSQVFVNGILSGDSLAFLQAVKDAPGRKFMVANGSVLAAAAEGVAATAVEVPGRNAYDAMPSIEAWLHAELNAGDVVLYAAGLGCKPTIWRLFKNLPEITHVDVGCFFDAAAGLRSRSWLENDEDERLVEFRRTILPWMQGEDGAA